MKGTLNWVSGVLTYIKEWLKIFMYVCIHDVDHSLSMVSYYKISQLTLVYWIVLEKRNIKSEETGHIYFEHKLQ